MSLKFLKYKRLAIRRNAITKGTGNASVLYFPLSNMQGIVIRELSATADQKRKKMERGV